MRIAVAPPKKGITAIGKKLSTIMTSCTISAWQVAPTISLSVFLFVSKVSGLYVGICFFHLRTRSSFYAYYIICKRKG